MSEVSLYWPSTLITEKRLQNLGLDVHVLHLQCDAVHAARILAGGTPRVCSLKRKGKVARQNELQRHFSLYGYLAHKKRVF